MSVTYISLVVIDSLVELENQCTLAVSDLAFTRLVISLVIPLVEAALAQISCIDLGLELDMLETVSLID